MRILVIDDHPLLADALRRMLEQDGHRVRTALGGREGLTLVRAARTSGEGFDVVVADYNMPDVDGLEVAAAVKQVAPLTPVILITAYDVGTSETLPAHVDAMMTKPPPLVELRAILGRVAATRTASESADSPTPGEGT